MFQVWGFEAQGTWGLGASRGVEARFGSKALGRKVITDSGFHFSGVDAEGF